MLSIMRIIICFASLLASWGLIVFSIVWLGHTASELSAAWLYPLWNDGLSAMSAEVPSVAGVFNQILIPEESAMSLYDAAGWSLQAAGWVLAGLFGFYSFRPITRDILELAGDIPIQELSENSPIKQCVLDLADQAGIKVNRVCLMQTQDINAFAIGKPFTNAIVLTKGLLMLPEGHLRWVIAHELAHLHHGDSIPQLMWLASRKLAWGFRSMRAKLLTILLPVLVRLPFVRLFISPIEFALVGLFLLTETAEKMASSVFRIFDLALQRQVEYQADRGACELVPCQYGIEVMDMLDMVDNSTSWLKSHPSAAKRRAAMTRHESKRFG